jgi:hypothetical protein
MRKKYSTLRFPIEAKVGFATKQRLIENKIKEITGKQRRVSLAETLRFFAKRQYVIYDDELINHFYRKKNKFNGEMVV